MKVHIVVTDEHGETFEGEVSLTPTSNHRAVRQHRQKVLAANPPAAKPERSRVKGKRHGGEGAVFHPWIQGGFFDKPRTSGEILKRFHAEGKILKQTSLPGYLLGATRAKILVRNKKDVDGKLVYVYTAPKRS